MRARTRVLGSRGECEVDAVSYMQYYAASDYLNEWETTGR